MDEHITQFPWLTINMVSHYINTYPNGDALPTAIDTHHQTVVSGITDWSPVNAVRLRATTVATPSGTILTTASEGYDSQGP
jgi:hypothetical protein